VKTDLIELRAVVTDRRGQPMTDSKKNRMTLSSLMLSDPVTAGIHQIASNTGDGAVSPSRLVQGIRYYRDDQPLLYIFRLYNALRDEQNESAAMMQIEILKDEQPLVSLPWQPVSTRMLGRDAKGLVIGGQLSLGKTQPGIYELRVSVKDSKMKRPAQRSVAFGIEP
jgi:hypothetical protein